MRFECQGVQKRIVHVSVTVASRAGIRSVRMVVAISEQQAQKLDLNCWRCGKQNVWFQVQTLEDDAKVPFYMCYSCQSKWYSYEDILPYIMRLKLQLRNQIVRPVEEQKTDLQMRPTRPP